MAHEAVTGCVHDPMAAFTHCRLCHSRPVLGWPWHSERDDLRAPAVTPGSGDPVARHTIRHAAGRYFCVDA